MDSLVNPPTLIYFLTYLKIIVILQMTHLLLLLYTHLVDFLLFSMKNIPRISWLIPLCYSNTLYPQSIGNSCSDISHSLLKVTLNVLYHTP